MSTVPSPVFRWKMDEGSGTSLSDFSGNDCTGTGEAIGSTNVTQLDGVQNASFSAWLRWKLLS